MASLATYDSDSSDSSYEDVNPENDKIISDLLKAYKGKEIFLLTPIKGLVKVILEESANPKYPSSTFLKWKMLQKGAKQPYLAFVRLGDTREDDNPRLMPWYLFVFPETFPDTSYTKASLEKKLEGLSWPAVSSKVTAANDAWLNRTKAVKANKVTNKRKRSEDDVIDLTSDSELQSLFQESVLKF